MKKTQEIIGLPVFSVVDGKKIGQVKELIVNPEESRTEFFMVSDDSWYAGAKVLPFKSVIGVGEHAVTTESQNQLIAITDNTSANNLLTREVDIKGKRVLTSIGNLIGIVNEYMIDEQTGNIARLQFKSSQDESKFEMIDSEQVLTYGSEVIIVKDQSVKAPVTVAAETPAPKPSADTSSPPPASASGVTADSAALFRQKQRDFLLKKKVTQDITDDQGKVIIPAGTVIEEETIAIAEKSNKFRELTQCAK